MLHDFFNLLQSPILLKEYGAVTSIDVSPMEPHEYAVTTSTRVSLIFFLHLSFLWNLRSSAFNNICESVVEI